MRLPLFDRNAKRKTVSVTLNSDLVARSRALGINISQVAEAALVQAFETAEKAKLREEFRIAAEFTDAYIREHGHPFPESRAMFMPDPDDPEYADDDAA